MNPKRLKVVEPCSQRWERFSGGPKERYCDSCERTVHNLDALSPSALRRLVDDNPEGICGTYLGAPGSVFTPGEQTSSPPRVVTTMAVAAAAAASLMVGCGEESASPEQPTAVESTQRAEPRRALEELSEDERQEVVELLRQLGAIGYVD